MNTDNPDGSPPVDKKAYEISYKYGPFVALFVLHFALLLAILGISWAAVSNLASNMTLGFGLSIVQLLAAFIVVAYPVATYRLADMLDAKLPVLWSVGTAIPGVSILVFIMLFARARGALHSINAEPGMFGAKLPFHPEWSRPHLVTYGVVFAVCSLAFPFFVTLQLADNAIQSEFSAIAISLVSKVVVPVSAIILVLALSFRRRLSFFESVRLAVYGHFPSILLIAHWTWKRYDFISRYGSAELLDLLIHNAVVHLAIALPVTTLAVWLFRSRSREESLGLAESA